MHLNSGFRVIDEADVPIGRPRGADGRELRWGDRILLRLPLRFLAGCRTRRLNQALSCFLALVSFEYVCCAVN